MFRTCLPQLGVGNICTIPAVCDEIMLGIRWDGPEKDSFDLVVSATILNASGEIVDVVSPTTTLKHTETQSYLFINPQEDHFISTCLFISFKYTPFSFFFF